MRVAVIGAGMAGLAAARQLAARGADVRLFEAGARRGGRVRTETGEEWGGEWLDADHLRALALCADLGLTAVRDAPEYLLAHGGRRALRRSPWPEAQEDVARFEARAEQEARALEGTPPELDARSVAEFVQETCQSEAGRWLATAVTRSDEGDDLDKVSQLGWLSDRRLYLDRGQGDASAYRVAEGMQALADRLWLGDVCCGAKLVSCVEEGAGLKLAFADGTTERTEAAIVTIPPRAARAVMFKPPLPACATAALEAIGMTRTVKTILRFDRAWWRDEGWTGYLLTDRRIQQVWLEPFAPFPTLCVYTCGADAVALAAEADPVAAALVDLAALFPAAPELFEGGTFVDWIGERGIGGGFSLLPPGAASLRADLPRRHGRVFFAGEHLATWRGFLEGALESAESAVTAMMTA